MKQTLFSTKHIIVFLLMAALVATFARPVKMAQAAPAGPQAVITWNAITLRTVITVGLQPPPPRLCMPPTCRQLSIMQSLQLKEATSLTNQISVAIPAP